MKRLFGFLGSTALLLYVFIYLPLVVVVLLSFNNSRMGDRWSGVTLKWYRTALQDEQILGALKRTMLLALCSTIISSLLGSLLGYGLSRHRFLGRGLVTRMVLLGIAVPDIVMAVSLLLFYALLRQWSGVFELGLMTMVVSHVTFQIPFVAMVVRARLHGFDVSLEEAASDLGASRWQRLLHVTWPLLRPGIVAGGLLAFTLSLDDFLVSFFTSGAGSTTLPIYIYSSVKRGITPEIHALSAIIIAGAIIGTVAISIATARGKPRTGQLSSFCSGGASGAGFSKNSLIGEK